MWYYIEYVNRIHAVSKDWKLQFGVGERVSLSGRYQYVGDTSSFQVVWFGEGQTLVAIVNTRADGL